MISQRWELIPLEKRKLVRSALYAILAVVVMAVASYLQQFGLPEQFKYLAPFLPFIVNFLNKWAREHKYQE